MIALPEARLYSGKIAIVRSSASITPPLPTLGLDHRNRRCQLQVNHRNQTPVKLEK